MSSRAAARCLFFLRYRIERGVRLVTRAWRAVQPGSVWLGEGSPCAARSCNGWTSCRPVRRHVYSGPDDFKPETTKYDPTSIRGPSVQARSRSRAGRSRASRPRSDRPAPEPGVFSVKCVVSVLVIRACVSVTGKAAKAQRLSTILDNGHQRVITGSHSSRPTRWPWLPPAWRRQRRHAAARLSCNPRGSR